MVRTHGTTITTVDALPTSVSFLATSFERSLRAENKSARTIQTYTEALRLFMDFLGEHGMPLSVTAMSREHV